jgi:hypothetical protein
VGSSSQVLFGEVIWSPLVYLDRILMRSYDAPSRAGAFFISACFAYSAIFSSIFENSIPAGNDIAALCKQTFSYSPFKSLIPEFARTSPDILMFSSPQIHFHPHRLLYLCRSLHSYSAMVPPKVCHHLYLLPCFIPNFPILHHRDPSLPLLHHLPWLPRHSGPVYI